MRRATSAVISRPLSERPKSNTKSRTDLLKKIVSVSWSNPRASVLMKSGRSYPFVRFQLSIASGVTYFVPSWDAAMSSGELTIKKSTKVRRLTPISIGMAYSSRRMM